MKKIGFLVLVSVLFVGLGFSAYADEGSSDELVTNEFSVDDKVQVLWKNKWYDATVIDVGDEGWKISYVGYDATWDEWVGSDRIRAKGVLYGLNQKVDVLWNGTWYSAKIIQLGSGKWKIAYDGYASSWDEWVTKERIRPFTKK